MNETPTASKAGDGQTQNALLPCPFCGRIPTMRETHRGHFIVLCLNEATCGCELRTPLDSYIAAVNRWNKRVAPSVAGGNASLEHTGVSSENPTPSTELEEIARETAERRISELEELGYLDFDGGEQEDRQSVVRGTKAAILTALTKASSLKPKTLEETKDL